MARTLLLLCREPTTDVTALAVELQRRGVVVQVATPSELAVRCRGNAVEFELAQLPIAPDAVLGWVSLHQREHGLWLLKAFELAGVTVLNGHDVLSQGQNKFLGSVLLARHGLPHIAMELVADLAAAERAAARLGYPVVLKPIVGAKGQGVCRVDDRNALRNLVAFYLREQRAVYVQQHVAKPDRDIRVRVVDFRAGFAFYRHAAPGEFLTNLSAGGDWQPCALDAAMARLAEAAARAFNAPIAGVDLVEDGRDYRVIEVNTTPAITWPHDPTVLDVADWVERELLRARRAA
jgi:ribosomal protein S6--L-glutamate ligase